MLNCIVFSFVAYLQGGRKFERSFLCRYCYQTETWEHDCAYDAKCKSIASPPAYYRYLEDFNFRYLCQKW